MPLRSAQKQLLNFLKQVKFQSKAAIVTIGKYAFPVISISFIFAGLTIVITSYLHGIAHIKLSLFIIVLRQIVQ